MKIWILSKGEREGPFEEYQLRGRIQEGELQSDTPAWHEGMEQWGTLADITVLAGEFEEQDRRDVEEMFEPPETKEMLEEQKAEAAETREGQEAYRGLFRRFVARWLDVFVYQMILLGGFVLLGRDLYDFVFNPSFHLLHLLPLVLIESWMLAQWGVTPGKWLMRLKVVNLEGETLSYGKSLLRTTRVWFLGIGALLPLLILVGHILGLICVRKFGGALWDVRSKQVVVQTGRPKPQGWVIAVGLLGFSLIVQSMLMIEPVRQYVNKNADQFTLEQRQVLESLLDE